MNNHAKRLVRELEALGFRRDHDARTSGRAYVHPNQPDQVIKVFDHMSDTTITAAKRKANKIADTGWSGPRMPSSIKERARIKKASAKAKREAEAKAREERAQAKEAEYIKRRVAEETARKRREIENLMRPGYGR